MKLWLLELLACPIDKKFPLELTILKWFESEKTQQKLSQLLQGYKEGNVLFKEMESPINLEYNEEADNWQIHDDLIIKPTPVTNYLSELLEKISELEVIHDVSSSEGQKILDLLRTKVKDNLTQAMQDLSTGSAGSTNIKDNTDNQNSVKEIITRITPDLELLNLFKYHLEIEDALIVCPYCHRWYPVFDAIPQLLPDALRNSKEDQDFRNKWEKLVKFPES